MPYVKLDTGLLDSSLWLAPDQTRVFLAALLMAQPQEFLTPLAVLPVGSTEPTGEHLEPGWYGFVPAAGPALVMRAMLPLEPGMAALAALCAPDPDSRTPANAGRRLARVDGGFVVLNYMAYRDRDYSAAERMRRLRARRKAEQEPRTVTRNGPADPGTVTRNAGAKPDESANSSALVGSSAPAGPASPPPDDRSMDALRANSRNALRSGVTRDVTVTQAEAEAEEERTSRVDTSPSTEGGTFAVTVPTHATRTGEGPDFDPNNHAAWLEVRAAYPAAPRSDWITAQAAACQAVATGRATWPELLEGVRRYRTHCEQTGRMVSNPSRWFGAHDEPWKQPWTVNPKPGQPPPPPDALRAALRDLVNHVRPPGLPDDAAQRLAAEARAIEDELRAQAHPPTALRERRADIIRRLARVVLPQPART